MEIERAASNDVTLTAEWFTSYKAIKEKYGIQLEDEYNMDESGFRIAMGGNQWVIMRVTDTERLSTANETNRDWATVIQAISTGGVLPPAAIIKGLVLLHQHFNEGVNIPDHYVLGAQTAGYSNEDLAFEWVQYFDKWSARRQRGATRMLLLDGHGSHLTYDFVEYCE
jgi:hypothetical protein